MDDNGFGTWSRYCEEYIPCGSRVTCSPPPQDTDEDYLVLVPTAKLPQLFQDLKDSGWELGGSASNRDSAHLSGFTSWTRGRFNLILTANPLFYAKFRLATGVSRALNIMDKRHRIVLFQAILYGQSPDEA